MFLWPLSVALTPSLSVPVSHLYLLFFWPLVLKGRFSTSIPGSPPWLRLRLGVGFVFTNPGTWLRATYQLYWVSYKTCTMALRVSFPGLSVVATKVPFYQLESSHTLWRVIKENRGEACRVTVLLLLALPSGHIKHSIKAAHRWMSDILRRITCRHLMHLHKILKRLSKCSCRTYFLNNTIKPLCIGLLCDLKGKVHYSYYYYLYFTR